MSVIDNFHRFASRVRIAHHVPGRIRLRLSLGDLVPALDGQEQSLIAQANSFKAVLDTIPGVRSIRVNFVARSCTVEYDQGVIPFKAWPDFLAGQLSDEACILKCIIEEKFAEVACA